jgi:hypothetical protein
LVDKIVYRWEARGRSVSSSALLGLSGLGVGRGGFTGFAQGFPVQVAAVVHPLFVLFDGEGADQPQASGLVGEDAHDVGAPFKLLVEPFKQVGRLEVLVVFTRHAIKHEGLLDGRLHPQAQFGVFGLPAHQPLAQVVPGLVDVATVI